MYDRLLIGVALKGTQKAMHDGCTRREQPRGCSLGGRGKNTKQSRVLESEPKSDSQNGGLYIAGVD